MAWLHDRQGQLNGKGSAAILTKARSAHYASMKFDKMLGDREAQSQATMASRRRAIGLPKAIENVRRNSGVMPIPVSAMLISILGNSPAAGLFEPSRS